MKLKLLAVIVLVAVGIGTAVWATGGLPTGAAATPRYLTASVTRGDVTQDVAATGSIAATASYGLSFGAPARLVTTGSTAPSSATTWPVTSVSVAIGQSVKKGETLAVADTSELAVQLADATSSYRAANTQLLIAREQLADATTTDATRQARIGVYNAEQQVSAAKQKRADLAAQIKAATIRSPIDGTVVAVNIAAGFDAPSGDAIVVDATSLEVTAEVVESDLPSVAIGQAAQVTIGAVGATLDGKVTTVAPVATSSSGSNSVVSYAVTIGVTDATNRVRPGMSADISISTASAKDVLTVPSGALVGANGSYLVRMLGANGEVTTQPVTVGLVTNTRAEVRSGLTEGQTVITGVATPQSTTTNAGGSFGGAGGLGGGGRNFGGGGTQVQRP